MDKKLIEEQAERVTSLFSYRNGYSTPKDAFIAGAEWMQKETALTWEDVKNIVKIFNQVEYEAKNFSYDKIQWAIPNNGIYQETLHRFIKSK